MFGNRRVPSHIVFTFSVLLAVLLAWGAFSAFKAHAWLWFGLATVLAIWFAVDAVRSYQWTQAKKRQEIEQHKSGQVQRK